MEEGLTTCSVATKDFFFNLILPVIDKVLQGFNIYFLIESNHPYWAAVTVAIILMPGLFEKLYWTIECCRGTTSNKKICMWILGFGPFTFHIGVWIWHLMQWCSDCTNESHSVQKTFSKSNVFKCLQAFFESAPQVLLTLVIMFVTWDGADLHFWFKIGFLSANLIMFGFTCVDHHLREMSGKTAIPRVSESLIGFSFFCLHFAVRAFVFALITVYSRWALLAIIGAHVLLNFLPIWRILRTDSSKNLWTMAASLFVPICFVSRDTVQVYGRSLQHFPGEKFHRFYKWNTFFFAFLSIVAMCVIVALLQMEILSYGCSEFPLFSCSAGCGNRDIFCMSAEDAGHEIMVYFGVPFVVFLNGLCVMSVWCMGKSSVLMGDMSEPDRL